MSLQLPSYVKRTGHPARPAERRSAFCPVAPLVLGVAFGAIAAGLPAQRVQVIAPGGIALVGPAGSNQGEDGGALVEMFENPNLDRYLRKAQSFLDAEDYTAAIEVLQDVIEGRTTEVVATRPEDGGPTDGAAAPDQPTQPAQPTEPSPSTAPTRTRRPEPRNPEAERAAAAEARNRALDARNSVFSHDGRLYRPVRRLCQELLARMPDIGIEIYRTHYEFLAEDLLREAEQDGSTIALERVANRYFVTLPAGRALYLLADRLMHDGRYRSAVQVLHDLLDIYPAANRQRLGISDVWCRFKIALCLRLAGEREAAHTSVQELADKHEQESLRVLGQLESVRDLPHSELFARDVVAVPQALASSRSAWLGSEEPDLVPLWQYRFAEPDPYREPKPTNGRDRNTIFVEGGVDANAMPTAGSYGPATWIDFDSAGADGVPHAVFFEHYRLRLADAGYGVLLRETDGPDRPAAARENQPRVRVAAADFALLRPVEDAERRYLLIGHRGNTNGSTEALKSSELIALRRDDWSRVWSTEQWLEGDDGLRNVTLLAAPTVFGERLLMPGLRRTGYTLECLDRSTGRPLWHTPLHAGGSPFYKAPGCPVVVSGGIALVATNAGCVAAVDAFAGDLRWIRRYERDDPIHSVPRPARRGGREVSTFSAGFQFAQLPLPGFWPNELVLHNGLVVLAPCDGHMLLSLDVATGQPVWMLDGSTRYAPFGKLQTLIGVSAKRAFLASDTHVVAVDLDGGLLCWCHELPPWDGPREQGRGRGAVVGSWVVLPGQGELLVLDGDGNGALRRLPLAQFGESREPLHGSYNVVVDGPWLGLGHAGGVSVYSARAALRSLAEDAPQPLRKAFYLTEAGERSEAEAVLAAAIRAAPDAAQRTTASFQLLALVRERATGLAQHGDVPAALAALDAIGDLVGDRAVRLNWHLARIELCKEVGDLRAHEIEQQRLYDYMEGRG